jgi:hypothetical protein
LASPVSANFHVDVLSSLPEVELRAFAEGDAMGPEAVGELFGVGRRYGETSTIALLPQVLEGLRIAEAIIEASRMGNVVLLERTAPMAQRDGPTD